MIGRGMILPRVFRQEIPTRRDRFYPLQQSDIYHEDTNITK